MAVFVLVENDTLDLFEIRILEVLCPELTRYLYGFSFLLRFNRFPGKFIDFGFRLSEILVCPWKISATSLESTLQRFLIFLNAMFVASLFIESVKLCVHRLPSEGPPDNRLNEKSHPSKISLRKVTVA